jgi:hypothetical protein
MEASRDDDDKDEDRGTRTPQPFAQSHRRLSISGLAFDTHMLVTVWQHIVAACL